jgi:16S rRNA processing protein RimM
MRSIGSNTVGKTRSSGSLVVVGKIVGWFGLKGFVKVHLFNKLTTTVTDGAVVMIGVDDDNAITCKIDEIVVRQKNVLIKFEGINDRTSAEKIKNFFLFTKNQALKRLPKGRWYVHDIIGCEVVSENGENLGIVNAVFTQRFQDVWEVRYENKTVLIPVVNEFIKHVDLRKKVITVHVIEGLVS